MVDPEKVITKEEKGKVLKRCPGCGATKMILEKQSERCGKCNRLMLAEEEFKFQKTHVFESFRGQDENLKEKDDKAQSEQERK